MSGESRSRAGLAMAGLCLLWFGWLLYLALHRWFGLTFGAFDIGIFDQGLWLLANGEEPFVTLRGLHLFADHASYLLYLLVPLYWLWEDARLLIILTTAAPAIAGWLSYRIGRAEGLKPWAAVLVGATVLAMPAMLWTPWDAFHPETVAVCLIPASYLAARRNRFVLAVVLAAIILLAKEDAGLVVAPYALFMWWRWPESRKHAAALGTLAVVITALSLFVVLPGHSPTGALIYTGRYTFDASLLTLSRAGYLAAMLLPGALALAAPRFLLVGLPITLANLASGHIYQHDIRFHYSAYLLGVLAVAVPLGSARVVSGIGSPNALRVLWAAASISVLMLIAVGPALVTWFGEWGGIDSEERAEFDALIAAVPDDAVVTATWSLAPHLAHRVSVYTAPNPFQERFWGAAGLPPLPDPATVEYLAIDPRKAEELLDPMLDVVVAEDWEVLQADTFVLARRR